MSTKVKIPNSTDNDIRFAGLRDVVQVYDPYKKEWKDWEQTGAIILPSTITITTTTLNGKPVTCVLGDYSQTTVFVDGAAVFQDIFTTGTATITSDEFSVEVEVTETGGSYSAVLEEVVGLVLWDGSSLQNGAIGYGSLQIQYSSSDSLKGKKLCFTFNQKSSYKCIVFIKIDWIYGGTSGYTNRNFNSSGEVANADYGEYFQSGDTWKCLINVDGATSITFNMRENGSDINAKTYCSKIWLE